MPLGTNNIGAVSTWTQKIITGVLLVTICASLFPPQVAFADTRVDANTGSQGAVNIPQSIVLDQGGATINGIVTGTQNAPVPQAGDLSTIPTTKASTQTPNSQQNTNENWCANLSTCLTAVVYMFTVGISGIFAYMCAYFFDFSVRLALSSNSYALDFITLGWALVRDLANMAFIFLIIYIALTIIFKADLANTPRTLAAVIVMAVLINFSFFMTRVVIDGGNILALQFYNAIDAPPIGQTNQGPGATAGSATAGAFTNNNTKDLTFAVLGATGVQGLLNTNSFKAFTDKNGFLTNVIIQIVLYVSLGLLLAILGTTFLGAGIKFMVRIIMMWFLIIASPIAFTARALTNSNGAKAVFNQWLNALINYGIYPGVFMFVFYIITIFMKSMAQGIQGGIVGQIFNDAAQNPNPQFQDPAVVIATTIANIGIRVGLIVAMLYYSLKLCDLIATSGSGWAGTIGKTLEGRLNQVKGFAFQQTAGRASNAAAQKLAGTRFGNTAVGYRLRNNVLGYISQKKVGGARSFQEYTAKSKERLDARKAANLAIDQKERDRETARIVDSVVAQRGTAHLSDAEISRIENLRQREIEKLKTEQVAAIAEHAVPGSSTAKFWSDGKMNMVRKGTVFNDAQTQEIYEAWRKAQAQQNTPPKTKTKGETPSTFTPTNEWQVVPSGAILPPGLDVRMNTTTGITEVRLPQQTKTKGETPGTFTPTNEWQVVPEGTQLWRELDLRKNTATGLWEARLPQKGRGGGGGGGPNTSRARARDFDTNPLGADMSRKYRAQEAQTNSASGIAGEIASRRNTPVGGGVPTSAAIDEFQAGLTIAQALKESQQRSIPERLAPQPTAQQTAQGPTGSAAPRISSPQMVEIQGLDKLRADIQSVRDATLSGAARPSAIEPYMVREAPKTVPLDDKSQGLLRQVARSIDTNTASVSGELKGVSGTLSQVAKETVRARKEGQETSKVLKFIRNRGTEGEHKAQPEARQGLDTLTPQ